MNVIGCLIIGILILSNPLIAETNNLDKTFLNITFSCRKFRIFDAPGKSEEEETNCKNTKLKENNLSNAQYNKWSEDYWNRQKESWYNLLKNLEKE
mgnify:FL=1